MAAKGSDPTQPVGTDGAGPALGGGAGAGVEDPPPEFGIGMPGGSQWL